MTVAGNITVQELAVIMTVEAMTGLITRLRAAVTPRTFRLPLVLLLPGSMLMPSVRLIELHTLQLKLLTVEKRTTFSVPRTSYGRVQLTVSSMSVVIIGTPWWLTPLETGFVESVETREIITSIKSTAETAVVELLMSRLTQLRRTHSRQPRTTQQSNSSRE